MAAQSQTARFSCQFDGCARTFSRQEHLQRHVLNHAGHDFTCERCRTVFKRPDLLDRHMARHRQKDAEGGKLMTRKRLYKDEHGNVVSKKLARERRLADQEASQDNFALPLSPPDSSSDLALSPSRLNNGPTVIQPVGSSELTQQQQTGFEPYLDDFLPWNDTVPALNDQGFTTGPFDDIFAPDTASSFNMPYTTANNYNWLFDLSFDNLLQSDNTVVSDLSKQNSALGCTNPGMASMNPMLPSPTEEPSGCTHSQQSAMKITNISAKATEQAASNTRKNNLTTTTQKPDRTTLQESPMSFLVNDTSLPIIDDISYERLVDVVEHTAPSMPDGSLLSHDNHLLTHSCLQSYLDLYFTRFNTAYPLIHMPSFQPAETESLLLLSMIILGATYADKDAHQLAVCIHDVLRPQIFSHSSFSAKPELWILQTILLTECLGKSRGGQRQHDMSHLFHGLLINLIRRSECQSASPETSLDTKQDIQQQWKTWIDLEQKKRLAQLCFVWDVQHAVLFSQSLCMSAFELRSTLSCDQALWEASTAEEWQKLWRTRMHASPHLLSVLKTYLKPQKDATATKHLNSLSRVVILHGLMSISWDMTRRDQTSLGVMGNNLSAGSWRDRMSKAYDAWKADFDLYSDRLDLSMPSTRDWIIATKAIYHSAHLILNAEVLDLQIYAGARHILGRPVSRTDYSRSQKVVKDWARTEPASAAKAVFHAAQLLSDATSSNNEMIVVGNLFHHPWTICLATLTIWSFCHVMPKASDGEDDEMIWDAKEDMQKLLKLFVSAPLDRLAKQPMIVNCTAGLTAVVSNSLREIRWGVVHDGVLVLKGLTPWRLIGDDR